MKLCIACHHEDLDELVADPELKEALSSAQAAHLLVELRLDRMPGATPHTLAKALKRLGPKRCVVTCRVPEQGGGLAGIAPRTPKQRLALWRAAWEQGVAALDVERTTIEQQPDLWQQIGANQPSMGHPRPLRLISDHVQDHVPSAAVLALWRRQAEALGADVVKLVGHAAHIDETFRLGELAQQSTPWRAPVIALATGEAGAWTRLLVGRGAHQPPWTYVRQKNSPGTAPGQIAWDEAHDLYAAHAVTPTTPSYAVIGSPIAHSRSPLLHNRALRARGQAGIYLALRVDGDPAELLRRGPSALGLKGVSVTLPHKVAVQHGCDRLTLAAKQAGAVNTLTGPLMAADGWRWQGDNTDGPAALACATAALGDVAGLRVVVLGAGGAARAVGSALCRAGANVAVWARRPDAAHEVAQAMGCSAVGANERAAALATADLLVQCTPVGMAPNDADSILSAQEVATLKPGCVVFDTVYAPACTALMRLAQNRGLASFGGLDMLARQADLQAQAFYGHGLSSTF